MSELEDLFEELFEEKEKKEEKVSPKPTPVKEELPPKEEKKEMPAPKPEEKELAESIVPVTPAPAPKPPEQPKESISKEAEKQKEQISVKELRPLPKLAIGEEEFDFSEVEEPAPKEVILIYGHKGHGKTYLAMSFPGKIVVLSFDRKSAQVKYKDFKGDGRIKVYDVMKYVDYSTPQRWLETAEKTFKFLNALLDQVIAKDPPDWIVIDGSEIFQQICEMTMRYRNNLMPFQGIANLNLWKERRMYIRQIHNKCLNIAKKGIIYTTYVDKDEIVVDGEIIARKDVPRWIDAIMYETDTVIRVTSLTDTEGTKRFIATVESSKGTLPTGLKVDITDKGYKAFKEALKSG